MFKIKKGQGMSMNVIIIAVLALLVLVILSVIFTTKMRDTRKNVDSCENNGGECVYGDYATDPNDPDYCNEDRYDRLANYDCTDDEDVCCIRG
ncbi:hypothetical protein C0585_07440 [Candidatus Woesearchaeota archaeon]|nr:MAG: hypothetical protein C0585_07440 [Candidatus Woesearchaeota archaeon]